MTIKLGMTKDKDWVPIGPKMNYQFDIPEALHAAVMAKSRNTGVKLAPWMRICFEKFLSTPVGAIVEEIEAFESQY